MTIPASFLAYQVLGFAAGAFLDTLIRWILRSAWKEAPWRRSLLELLALVAIGTVLLFAGRAKMAAWGSRPFFVPVSACFYAGVAFAAPRWILRRSLCPSSMGIGVLALAVYMLFFGPADLDVTRIDYLREGQPPLDRPLRIAHLTDLQTIGPHPRELAALEHVSDFRPDAIFFTGDYGTGGHDAQLHARRFLERLVDIAPTFAVIGDSEDRALMAWHMDGLPITWLDDASSQVQDGEIFCNVVGLDRLQPDPARAFSSVRSDLPTFVLAHCADAVLDLERMGLRADLLFAGHTHGGQIVLPLLGPLVTLTQLPRRYVNGLHSRDGSVDAIFVGRGLGMEGTWAPRMRFLCPPQIALFRIR